MGAKEVIEISKDSVLFLSEFENNLFYSKGKCEYLSDKKQLIFSFKPYEKLKIEVEEIEDINNDSVQFYFLKDYGKTENYSVYYIALNDSVHDIVKTSLFSFKPKTQKINNFMFYTSHILCYASNKYIVKNKKANKFIIKFIYPNASESYLGGYYSPLFYWTDNNNCKLPNLPEEMSIRDTNCVQHDTIDIQGNRKIGRWAYSYKKKVVTPEWYKRLKNNMD